VADRPRRIDALKDKAPGLHRFLTSQESPTPLLRDLAFGGLAILVVLMLMWTYTGRWGESPVVVVESGSMLHCENGFVPLGRDCDGSRFGRLGTVDPGDLIFVKDANGLGSLETFAGGGQDRYREPGDVVVYQPNGQSAVTPVIHRAMFTLVVENDGTYTLPELGLQRVDSLRVDDLGLDRTAYRLGATCHDVAWTHALVPGTVGLITKGDNNDCFDQSPTGLGYQPVRAEWLVGKARGELPWLGLVKLYFTDVLRGCPLITAGDHGSLPGCNYYNASSDAKAMLWITLAVLIGGPWAFEKVRQYRKKRGGAAPPETMP
jgi:signal peptidase I